MTPHPAGTVMPPVGNFDSVMIGPSCVSISADYKRLYDDAIQCRAKLCERFFQKVDATGFSSCWNWVGARARGYGKFKHGLKSYQAHRVAFAICRSEPLVSTLEIDHTCNNRSCVNPLHLEQVGQAENKLRGARRRTETKTHCKNGHRLDDATVSVWASGHRVCKVCRRVSDADRQRAPIRRLRCDNDQPALEAV